MSPRPLPRSPSLKLINAQVRNLLRDFRQGNALALARYSRFDVRPPDTSTPRVCDAQLIIAREYGYASWPKLKQHVEALARNSDSLEELDGS